METKRIKTAGISLMAFFFIGGVYAATQGVSNIAALIGFGFGASLYLIADEAG